MIYYTQSEALKENNRIYREMDGLYPVSYTHLDVYKRQK